MEIQKFDCSFLSCNSKAAPLKCWTLTSPPKPPLLHETPTFRGGRVKYYGIFSRQTANHGDPASNDLVTMMWHELWSREATVILQFLDLSSFSSKESSITLDSCSLVWNRIMWQVLPPEKFPPTQGGRLTNPWQCIGISTQLRSPPTDSMENSVCIFPEGFTVQLMVWLKMWRIKYRPQSQELVAPNCFFVKKSTKVVKRQGLLCFFNQMILPQSTRDYLW